jgi:hypothetical protein
MIELGLQRLAERAVQRQLLVWALYTLHYVFIYVVIHAATHVNLRLRIVPQYANCRNKCKHSSVAVHDELRMTIRSRCMVLRTAEGRNLKKVNAMSGLLGA